MADTIPLTLDDEMLDAIATAFDSGNILTVAYVDADGWAHVSRRGTTHVLDERTIAMWIRKRDDGLAAAIGTNPHLTLFFIDLAQRGVVYTFYGESRICTDPAVDELVWNASPEREKARDPERKGVVVIVDLVRVVAQGKRNFVMQA